MDDDFRVTEMGLELRSALQDMLLRRAPTHWVTLNFHFPASRNHAVSSLRRWSLKIETRLFRARRFRHEPMLDLFDFTALPEYTRQGHPHYHLVTQVHGDRHDWFNRCAGEIWKLVVPTGTSDVQMVRRSASDIERVIRYATKEAHRAFSYNEFICRNMLDLPDVGGGRGISTALRSSNASQRRAA